MAKEIPDDIGRTALIFAERAFTVLQLCKSDAVVIKMLVAEALMAERAKWEAEIGSIRRAYAELMHRVRQGEAYKENFTLRAENERLRGALEDCISTLALVEHPAFEDPQHGDEVRTLGHRIGFGALMSSASASWRKSLEQNGVSSGGEFVAGPCFQTVAGTLRRARAALKGDEDGA